VACLCTNTASFQIQVFHQESKGYRFSTWKSVSAVSRPFEENSSLSWLMIERDAHIRAIARLSCCVLPSGEHNLGFALDRD